MRKLFVYELLKELKEAKPNIICIEGILLLLKDILLFFNYKNTEEYE